MADANPIRKVKTPPFRMSFPNILEPRTDEDTGRKTYQLSMLFPPGTDLSPFKAAMKAAMEDKFGDDTKKWPKVKHTPADVIKDFGAYNAASNKPLPGDWAGWTLIRANSAEKFQPGVVGPTRGADGKFPAVRDPREVYSGRWARASIDAYHFAGKKNDGVTFGLKNVQLLKHDGHFAGAISAPEEDFDNASDEWSGGASVPDQFEKGDPGNTGNEWN
jgi:Protein of unknown function (DUF2815)